MIVPTASGGSTSSTAATANATQPTSSAHPASATSTLAATNSSAGTPAPSSAGSTITVSSTAALLAALKSAHSGETILMTSGTYSGVQISGINIPGNVTIASQQTSKPPVISGLNVLNSSGLTFSGLELSAAGSHSSYAFSVANSSNIEFTGVNVHGSMDNNPGDDTGGMYIHGSTNVTVQNSQFQQLRTGITELNNSHITITGNSFHDIETDGIDNSGSSYVNISNNTFTNFRPSTSAAHPDAIQFWTTNTTESAHDLTVTGNTISVGSGGQTQGIFISDQVGDLPYQRVNISNNVVTGELYNAIVVAHADSVAVTGNTVVASNATSPNAENSPSTGTASGSWIGIENSTDVDLAGNNSAGYQIVADSHLVQEAVNSINGVQQTSTIHSAVNATLGILSNTLVLTGTSKLSGMASTASGTTVIANNAGDRLYDNGAGSQTLIGGTGADTLISRYGSDTLTGGGGNDTFNISNTIKNDVITDFGRAGTHDYLNLSSFENAGMEPILTNSGNNVVISFSNSTSTVTLLGVHASDLIHSNGGFNH